jgi:hypothetical protein
MDFQTWQSAATIFAILLGAVLGSAAVGTACVVWVRKMVFGYGGSALCLTGMVLLGLSVWQSVRFGLSTTEVKFEA